MYSYEIEQYIKLRNYLLNNKEILEVIDIKKNSQIKRIHYDPFDMHYEVDTTDNYNLRFKVKELVR